MFDCFVHGLFGTYILCDVACELAKYRYSSNMRESSSESEDVDLESNYSSSENDDDIKVCYMNEPEIFSIFRKGNKHDEYSGK